MLISRRVYPLTYKVFLAIGLIVLIAKTVLVFGLSHFITAKQFSDVEPTLDYIGYFCKYTPRLDYKLVSTLAPDLVGVSGSLVGLVYSYRFNPSLIKNSKSSVPVCFFLCLAACTSYNTIINFVYITVALVWGWCWSFQKPWKVYKLGAAVIVITTFVQCTWSYLYWMLFERYIIADNAMAIGAITLGGVDEAAYFISIMTLYAFGTNILKKRVYSGFRRIGAALLHPFLQAMRPSLQVEEAPESLAKSLFHDFAYVMTKVLTFFYLYQFFNLISFALLIYVLATSMTSNMLFYVKATKFVGLPLLFLNLGLFMLVHVFHFQFLEVIGVYEFKYPWINFGLALAIIACNFYLIHLYRELKPVGPATSDSFWGLLLIIAAQNLKLVSISAVFLVGLTKINLFHTIFVVVSLVFMLRTSLAEKYFRWLIVYNMILLALDYFWLLLLPYINFSKYQYISEFLGLPLDVPLVWNIFPANSFMWLLLLISLIQQRAFDGALIKLEVAFTAKEVVDRNSKLLHCFLMCIEAPLYIGIWLGYFFMYFFMYISPLNLLNFLRLILLSACLGVHLWPTTHKLKENQLRTQWYWLTLGIYSGVLLVIRYVYQYLPFIPTFDLRQFSVIGVRVYGVTEMYQSMVPDCGILLISIIAYRSFFHERLSGIPDEVTISIENLVKLHRFNNPGRSSTWMMPYSRAFNAFVLLSVIIGAIYWQFSVLMFMMTLCASLYMMISIFYAFSVHKSQGFPDLDIVHRLRVWKWLFFIAVLANLLSYTVFLLNKSVVDDSSYAKGIWLYSFLGINVGPEHLLIELNYGYFLAGIFLVLERLALEQVSEYCSTIVGKWILTLKSVVKILLEPAIPVLLMISCFYSPSLGGCAYLLLILLSLFVHSETQRTRALAVIILFLSIAQYLVFLSNIDTSISPNIALGEPFLGIPWYPQLSAKQAFLVYSNLFPTQKGADSLFLQLVALWLCYVYFRYCAFYEDQAKHLFFSQQSEHKHRSGTLKRVLAACKYAVFGIAPIFILVIVLLFVSQNYGAISLIYCMISLVIINRVSSLYSSQDFNTSFLLRVVRAFMIFLCFDLLLQLVFQAPIEQFHVQQEVYWVNVIGVFSLSNNQDYETLKDNYLRLLLKILVFAGLYLINRLFQTKEYKRYRAKNWSSSNARNPTSLGLRLAQHFNTKRLESARAYDQEEFRFKEQLELLDKNIRLWNKNYAGGDSVTRGSAMPISAISKFLPRTKTFMETSLHVAPPVAESKTTVRVQHIILWLINPVLFEQYIAKFTGNSIEEDPVSGPPIQVQNEEIELAEMYQSIPLEEVKSGEQRPDDEEGKEEDPSTQRPSKKVVRSSHVSSSSFDNAERAEDSEDEEEKEVNFEQGQSPKFTKGLSWKDYLTLGFYILASNTEALVFLTFFINHYMYCSLESVVLPLSVLIYALLDNPRPSYKYYRMMLLYLELVFFVKFTIGLNVWEYLIGSDNLFNTSDPYKIGFANPSRTYSGNLLLYTLWDAVSILFILIHEYFLGKTGLIPKAEYDIETLEAAKARTRGVEPLVDRRATSYCARVKQYFQRLVPLNIEEKPGIDLYLVIVFVQLIILVFLFCCYSRMEGVYQDISESFKANQFDGRMVIAVLCHITLILLDRFLYLSQSTHTSDVIDTFNPMSVHEHIVFKRWPQVTRVCLHILLACLLHFLVFWYFPIIGNLSLVGNLTCTQGNSDNRCNNFQVNSYLKAFYIIYMAYLVFMALQIRYGVPISRTGQFPLQRNTGRPSKWLFMAYRSAPFLFEIRTMMDWTFTQTALDLFQWFKFEDISATLYLTKCNQIFYAQRKPGDAMPLWFKLSCGCCSLLMILGLVLLPLILFSSLNPIIEYNPVTALSVELGVTVNNGNYYQLYQAGRVTGMHSVTEDEWTQYQFNTQQEIQAKDKELMQVIQLPLSSDTLWGIPPTSQEALCNGLNGTTKTLLELAFSFKRLYPYSQQTVSGSLSEPLRWPQIADLYDVICVNNTNTSLLIPMTDSLLFRVPSAGTQITAINISYDKLVKGVLVSLKASPLGLGYWEVKTASDETVNFYVISEYYSMATFNFSVLTFYVSVVYVVGRLLRLSIAGGARNLNLTDMLNPQKLIDLCQAVYIYRSQGNLTKEEEYYFEILEILRSTEMTKYLTGHSSKKQKVS